MEQPTACHFLEKCNHSPHCTLLSTDYHQLLHVHEAIREEMGDELSCYSRMDQIV